MKTTRICRFQVDVAKAVLFFLFLLPAYLGMAQQPAIALNWLPVDEGVSFCEIDAPEKSVVNDSKLTLVRIDPSRCEFGFYTATQYENTPRSANSWADQFDLSVVVNAGMYKSRNNNQNKGFLKVFNHLNNSTVSSSYNAMLAANPLDSSGLSFRIFDMTCDEFSTFDKKYHSFCQVMRMMDCKGQGMAFRKRPDQSCSMVLVSTDDNGIIYIVFTRSPYTHLTMIRFLQQLPLGLRQTAYLEGGPQASLYLCGRDTVVSKFGSYVSNGYANDDNHHFWEIPNIIGVKRK